MPPGKKKKKNVGKFPVVPQGHHTPHPPPPVLPQLIGVSSLLGQGSSLFSTVPTQGTYAHLIGSQEPVDWLLTKEPGIQHHSSDYGPAPRERAPSWELLGPESEQRLRDDTQHRVDCLWRQLQDRRKRGTSPLCPAPSCHAPVGKVIRSPGPQPLVSVVSFPTHTFNQSA